MSGCFMHFLQLIEQLYWQFYTKFQESGHVSYFKELACLNRFDFGRASSCGSVVRVPWHTGSCSLWFNFSFKSTKCTSVTGECWMLSTHRKENVNEMISVTVLVWPTSQPAISKTMIKELAFWKLVLYR